MNEYERKWIEIILKAYPNLYNENYVIHSSNESDKKTVKLRKYFARLDKVYELVSKSHKKSDEKYLKELFYSFYIIKEENIPESYYKAQARLAREMGYGNIEITDEIRHNYAKQIIEDQKDSLDKWIEYFLYDEESKNYEMWEKYWVFQGIVGLGKYDKKIQKFKKRDLTTVFAFPDVDREATFTTINLMEEYLKYQKSEEEIKSALGSGNFRILYEFSIKQILNKGDHNAYGNKGEWIKYNQGSDYTILRNSLQGYYTGWCTASGENFAKSQIKNGDFYVYYSNNENNEAKIPRLAIRMDGHNIIGEIRGIAENQNIESEMLPILDEKLNEFSDKDKYYKKVSDMEKLTEIDNKVNNNIELTIDELKFLYEIDNNIEGFGYQKDPRIDEIRNKRNQKQDYSVLYNIPIEEITLDYEEYKNNKNIKILVGDLDLSDLKTAEDLILPKIIGGSLILKNLKTTEGLVLPETIGGSLNLYSLKIAEGLVFPEQIGGSLNLSSLETAEGLVLPKQIGSYLDLSSLKIAEGLKLPKQIGSFLDLSSLKTAKDLIFPKQVGGDLDLFSLETAEGVVLPETIGGYLALTNLKTAEGLKLPKQIGSYLDLSSLKTAEGLVLPKQIGSYLDLFRLKTAEGLVFPEQIGGSLNLSSLKTTEGLKLPKQIGRYLGLSSLKTAEGLVFPEQIGGALDLFSLETAEGLVLPKQIGGDLNLFNLETAEGLKLPKNFNLEQLDISKNILNKIENNPNLYYQNNEKTTQKQIINEENILEIEDQKQEKSKIKKIN